VYSHYSITSDPELVT